MRSAKIFKSGGSQAVRLPKEYRFEGIEVRIRRQGSAVILEPMPNDWSWLGAVCGPVEVGFGKTVLEHSDELHRPALRDVFK